MAISSTHQTDLASPNNPAQQPEKNKANRPRKQHSLFFLSHKRLSHVHSHPGPPRPGPARPGRNYRHEEIRIHVAGAGHPEESSVLSAGRSKHG